LVFVSAMVVSGGELVTAGLIGASAAALVMRLDRPYPLPALTLALALAAVLAWLIVNTLYMALAWAWTMQKRADESLELARDHQGELARTLKALDNSNIILRRTQRELISARQQAEAARGMKEQFAANVSHELRTPLNLILGFSEIMSLSPEVYGSMQWPPTLKQDINQVYRSARHLLGLIDDVLDLSRFEIAGFTLNKTRVALTPLLADTVEMARDLFHDRPVRLESAIAGDLPAVEVDAIRIRQVLLNLLTNAARFTEAGRGERQRVRGGPGAGPGQRHGAGGSRR
jgi:signal transduction histidine kinase